MLSLARLCRGASAALSRKWSTIPPMPHARYGLATATLNNKLYAIDGYGPLDNGQQRNTNFVDVYDPATNSWSNGVPTNLARYSLAAVALGGKLYAVGGSDVNVKSLNTVEVYDPLTNTWTFAPPLSVPRVLLAAATLDN